MKHSSSPAWNDSCDSPQNALARLCLERFCDPERFAGLLSQNSKTASDWDKGNLSQCGLPILELLISLSRAVADHVGDLDMVIQRLNDLIGLSNEKFYAYPFRDVPVCWRDLFWEASLLKFTALAVKGLWTDPAVKPRRVPRITFESRILDEMVRTVDMALIMAGPPTSLEIRNAIDVALDLLQQCNSSFVDQGEENRKQKRRKLDTVSNVSSQRFPLTSWFVPPLSNPIPRSTSLSFDSFEKHMLHPRDIDVGAEPIIITGVIDGWPARSERPWSSPEYLLSKTIGGRRLVPIETGRSYVEEGWGQKIITFREFIDDYVLPDGKSSSLATGYLAQHNLFAQIPSLRQDIAIPDYCYTSPPPPHPSSPLSQKHPEIPQLEDPLLNAWFGPTGTISPLHTDPYHNILSQVVGRKYVRLYAPREGEKLYARGIEDGGVDMSNTSAVDVGILAGWDGTEGERTEAHLQFPCYKEAESVDCILEEGECLYIPVGWWHYVRSLSVSFSVSFWWN